VNEALLDIEAIKQLKARYFRLMDTKQWEAFGEVFTEDAELDVSDDAGREAGHLSGGRNIADGIRHSIDAAKTVHHGHMPEIEVTGPDTAKGIWAMFDRVEFSTPNGPAGIQGYGHYHETYRKVDGAWRIASLKLVRLRRDPL
jgi:hypothetical protein